MDVLGENHYLALNEANSRIASEIDAVMTEEQQHASSGTCRQDPSDLFTSCSVCQTIKASKVKLHPIFIVAFDNIDIRQERRQMTLSAQNQDIHSVNHEIIQNKVSGNSLDAHHPKANHQDVPNITFLPDANDQSRQRLNYVILDSRVLVTYFDCRSL